jgi:hypothetical protein
MASIAVVNVARADPGFAHGSLVNSRGAAGVVEEERIVAEGTSPIPPGSRTENYPT